MNRTDSLFGEYDEHINTYLQLPVGIGLAYNWYRFRVTLEQGLYAGYWLAGRAKGKTANIFTVTDNTNANGQSVEQFQLSSYNERTSFVPDRDNRWEWGWWLGPGLQYQVSSPWWLTIGAKYYQSQTSQVKQPVNPVPAYNRTWTFSVGGLWSPGKSKKTL